MQLRDIMVVIDGSARDAAVLGAAIGVAQAKGARLTAFCPLELQYPPEIGLALSGDSTLPLLQEQTEALTRHALEKAEALGQRIMDRIHAADVRGDWEIGDGFTIGAVTRRARTADLVVISQADPDHRLPVSANGMIEDLLLSGGRPVLLVPYAGRYGSIGRKVLVGWNGTREAVRAVHDALMLLDRDSEMVLLTVEAEGRPSPPDEMPGAAMAQHLARHDVKVTLARTVADGIGDSDAILSYAADFGADLLVMGSYGHTRLREMILGGVSRNLLRHMTVPVLMSH